MGLDEPRNDPLIFAYYVTGHGFGHATRVVEVSVCEFIYIHIYFFKLLKPLVKWVDLFSLKRN